MSALASPLATQGQRVIPIATTRIVSIFPLATMPKEIPVERGFRTYSIPASKRGEYQIIDIDDSMNWQRDLSNVNEDNPVPGMVPMFQFGRDVAKALVTLWTNHTIGTAGKPGIAVLPEGMTEPSPELLRQLEETQTVYARALVQEGNDKKAKGDERNITELHRAMAFWLYGQAANKLPWYGKPDFAEVKECVGCRKEINKNALRCEHCSLDLVDWHLKYDLEATEDPAVQAVLDRVKAGKAPTAPTSKITELPPAYVANVPSAPADGKVTFPQKK